MGAGDVATINGVLEKLKFFKERNERKFKHLPQDFNAVTLS